MQRARRLAIASIASLAVLLASFAPLLAHAFGGTTPTPWAEICSAQGIERIAPSEPAHGTGAPQAPAHLLEHCPFCSLHVDVLGVPPASPALPVPAAAGPRVPRALVDVIPRAAVWAAAQPRAPPLRS